MSDMSSMSRERKKNQLRRQMISSDKEKRQLRPEQEEDSDEVIRKAVKKVRRRRFVIFLVILVIAAALGFGIYQYFIFHQYTTYTAIWEKPVAEGGAAQYEAFGGNVLKYTKDGASYINNEGKTVWMQSYEMKSPVVSVNGDYAVIAGKYHVYLQQRGLPGNCFYRPSNCKGNSRPKRRNSSYSGRFQGQLYPVL